MVPLPLPPLALQYHQETEPAVRGLIRWFGLLCIIFGCLRITAVPVNLYLYSGTWGALSRSSTFNRDWIRLTYYLNWTLTAVAGLLQIFSGVSCIRCNANGRGLILATAYVTLGLVLYTVIIGPLASMSQASGYYSGNSVRIATLILSYMERSQSAVSFSVLSIVLAYQHSVRRQFSLWGATGT